MDNQADVGLVNAHAEGVGGHHYARPALLPVALALVAHGRFKSGVVKRRAYAAVGQGLGYLLGALAAPYVNDGRAVGAAQQAQRFVPLVARPDYEVGKVLALETHAEDVLAPEAELILDVVYDARRGRGRERKHGGVRMNAPYVAYAEV